MSDKTKDVVDASESEGMPTPEFSQPLPQDSPGADDALVNTLIERLTPAMQEIVKKAAQSEKDKGIAKASKDASDALAGVNDMRAFYDKMKAYTERYGSEDAALLEMERDAKIDQAIRSQNSGQISVGAERKPWTERQAEILKEARLEPNDARMAEWLRESGKFANEDAYIESLAKKAFEWSQSDAKKPVPSAGSVAQITPSVPSGDGKYTAEKYKENMLAAVGDKKKIEAIKAAAKADGVDVDNIGFV